MTGYQALIPSSGWAGYNYKRSVLATNRARAHECKARCPKDLHDDG